MNQLPRALTLLTCTIGFACTKSEPVPERTETVISALGGAAKSAAGELTLNVPAGAVPDGTRIVITTVRDAVPPSAIGPTFELSSEPSITRFTPTIAIAIANPRPTARVRVANLDDATPVLVGGAAYDVTKHVASAELEHFSRYGLVVVTTTTGTTTPSCPEARPVPGAACGVPEELSCTFGEECCCGACYPELSCGCRGGLWACFYLDRCLGAQITCGDAGPPEPDSGNVEPLDAGQLDGTVTSTDCPAEADVQRAACPVAGLTCAYGEEVCCGQSFPSMYCTCDGARYACRATDACLGVPSCDAN